MKARISMLLMVSLSVFTLLLTGSIQAQSENDMERLQATFKEFVDAYSRVDIEKIVGIYAEDAMYLIPEMEILRGRQAIREYLKGFAGAKIEFKQEIVEMKIDGDLAYVVVNQVVTSHMKDQVQTGRNKFLHIWKKQKDGSWKVLIDMVNSRPNKG
jgi:uncharacterized protein (TIGR02246 family)